MMKWALNFSALERACRDDPGGSGTGMPGPPCPGDTSTNRGGGHTWWDGNGKGGASNNDVHLHRRDYPALFIALSDKEKST
jgi:hypothetical protein